MKISIEKHIQPEKFLSNNSKQEELLVFIQNQAHEILQSFLNGGLSNKGYVFYPLINELSNEIKHRMKLIKKGSTILINKGYNFLLTQDYATKQPTPSNCAHLLSATYKDLASYTKKPKKTEIKPKVQQLKINDYKKDLETRKQLSNLQKYANKNLKQYLSGFYLQGSLATNDYIKGWSDCDTVSIISKNTINNPNKLLKLRKKLFNLRKYFYAIDPLQHHGTIIVTEYDLNSYSNAYFPLSVLRYAKTFFPDNKQTIHIRNSKSETIQAVFWFKQYFKILSKQKTLSSYEVKNMLHAVTLFPTLYLQLKNVIVYKKFSFAKAKKDFTKSQWSIIDEVSDLRKNWEDYHTLIVCKLYANINPIAAYQINYRFIDLFEPIKQTNQINTKKIITEMSKLYDIVWKKIENGKL